MVHAWIRDRFEKSIPFIDKISSPSFNLPSLSATPPEIQKNNIIYNHVIMKFEKRMDLTLGAFERYFICAPNVPSLTTEQVIGIYDVIYYNVIVVG